MTNERKKEPGGGSSRVNQEERGRRLESGDAWIIATAVHRRLPLVSHDADHLALRIPKLEVISALAETTETDE